MNQSPSTRIADDDQRTLSTAIVGLVAETEEVDPIELRPLYDVIDPDFLNSIRRTSPGLSTLEFRYEGHRVAVEPDGDALAVSLSDPALEVDGSRAGPESPSGVGF